MQVNFTVGCDPEIFLKKGGKYVSAVGLIGGSKDHPRPISKDGHAVLEDNVAVEFNIPPAATFAEFHGHIQHVLAHLRQELPGFEFIQESAVSFHKEELNTPQAQEFGCEPDYDAWNMVENKKPCAEDKNLRSCGGHVHVGSDVALGDPVATIRAMDLFLGVPSTRLDSGTLRRNLYGKAGCFRPKPYGVEYRTLSNFWIFDEGLTKWVYDQTQKALEFVASGKTINDEDGKLIQLAINDSNEEAYAKLAKSYALV
jgi:hypothetical protein